jgi:hypothetical protein
VLLPPGGVKVELIRSGSGERQQGSGLTGCRTFTVLRKGAKVNHKLAVVLTLASALLIPTAQAANAQYTVSGWEITNRNVIVTGSGAAGNTLADNNPYSYAYSSTQNAGAYASGTFRKTFTYLGPSEADAMAFYLKVTGQDAFYTPPGATYSYTSTAAGLSRSGPLGYSADETVYSSVPAGPQFVVSIGLVASVNSFGHVDASGYVVVAIFASDPDN